MLRRVVQWVSALAALIGAGLLLAGVAVPGVQLLLTGLIILVAVRYESWRERASPPVAGSDWHSTGERFEDPGTGTIVEVQYNARTGERRYQPAKDG